MNTQASPHSGPGGPSGFDPQESLAPGVTEAPAVNTRVADAGDPVAVALARLEASRAGLRQVMIPPRRTARRRPSGPGGASAQAAGAKGAGFAGWLPEGLQQTLESATAWLRRHPVSALMVDGVKDWWQRQPLRHAAAMAGDEVASVAVPLIRRHPVAAVGLAAAAGALVVVGRPWRWRVFGGSDRPLSRRMMRWVSSQIPLQAALGALMALLMDQARQAAHAETPSPEQGADTHPAAPTAAAAGPL